MQAHIQKSSPFSTQQGIKGAEFERLPAVLDDNERPHVPVFSGEVVVTRQRPDDRRRRDAMGFAGQ